MLQAYATLTSFWLFVRINMFGIRKVKREGESRGIVYSYSSVQINVKKEKEREREGL